MSQVTYNEAMNKVYSDEGGYSNDAGDPGGPTNYGITIADARMYWKSNATPADVRSMPKSVAADIYSKHYATPLQYNSLPPGVDYAVLDYGINSGTSRAAKVLQQIVGVPLDGVIGPATITAVYKMASVDIINQIYAERLKFLKGLGTWATFGKGWQARCTSGKALALQLASKYPRQAPGKPAGALIAAGGTIAASGVAISHYPHLTGYIIAGTIAALVIGFTIYAIIKRKS